MSRQTYIDGFCKAASSRGIDPRELANFVMSKKAQAGGSDIWKSLSKWLEDAKAWYGKQNDGVKALIGAGGGALLGGALGSMFGNRGAGTGALIGGLGGAAATVDWSKLFNAAGSKSDALPEGNEDDRRRGYLDTRRSL